MDSEYPDPEDEYEMRFADELEMMDELDFDESRPPIMPKANDYKVKKSLNFNEAASPIGSRSNSSFGNRVSTPDEARKRQQDEMFGSLSDDEELCSKDSNPAKKSRNEQNVNPIPQQNHSFLQDDNACNDYIPASILAPRPKRYVFRLIPEEPHLAMTTHNGQKLYIRMKSAESIKIKEMDLLSSNKPGKLLKISVQAMKQQLENEKRSKSSFLSNEHFERRLHELESLELKVSSRAPTPEIDDGDKENVNSTDLWMERYRPKNYLDLLSEENVNRTLLHWLKLWDKAVFNREVKIKVAKTDEVSKPKWSSTATKGRFEPKKFEKFKKNTDGELKEELDSSGRPLQRIVLISGPPGLGKTTLAHVVARHAGYNSVEMNASDERNVEAFKLQLENATQMRSVLGSDPRPNCLIIDEIDGAPAASINFLVNALHSQEGNQSKEKVAGKKKKKSSQIVSRPVICICNELYTPSLRPLRQVALVLQFPPTNPSKLAQRLMCISKEQSMQADMSSLLALCEKADYDIRSCLATLCFLKTLKRPLRYSDVVNMNIGHKDNHKSLFQVWQEIFHIPRPKRRQFINERDGPLPLAPDVDRPLDPNIGNTASMPARFMNVLHAVYSCGEYDRLLLGVFDNYPTIKFKDSYMQAVNTALDWMCFYDLMNKDIQHSQNYTTYGYLPFTFVALHFQLAAVLSQKIKYPTTQAEVNAKMNQNQSIVTTMLQDLRANVRVTNSRATIIRDIIPFSLPIISPTLRPVSAQLYTAAEKETIHRIIQIMISYNLTFRQEKAVDGTYRYCLEPNIEQVCLYDVGGENQQRRSLTYSVKQMLAREIDLEKMRLFESNWGPMNAPKSSEVIKEPQPPTKSNQTTMWKPKAPPMIESLKPATDFFGRPLKTPPKKKNADGSVVETTQHSDVWYHFKEGYSNAVRRNVKITDFV